jgi:DNA-binding response OmpR family regulator
MFLEKTIVITYAQTKTMKKVLIVDDDRDLLLGLKTLLSYKGYNIRTTENGSLAPKITLTFRPDIIILDVHLRDSDGCTICNSLKSDVSTSHIPILMISADAEMKEIMNGCRADGFLPKPIRLVSLFCQLENLTA